MFGLWNADGEVPSVDAEEEEEKHDDGTSLSRSPASEQFGASTFHLSTAKRQWKSAHDPISVFVSFPTLNLLRSDTSTLSVDQWNLISN